MMSKVRIICFATILMMIMIAGFAHAQAVNPARPEKNHFQAQCEDLKYTCGTTFYKNDVEASCSHPPADWKTQPVYANIVVTYKCASEKQDGMEVWVCRGFLGVSPNFKATFTPEEFKDAQTRCTRLCSPCPKGWK